PSQSAVAEACVVFALGECFELEAETADRIGVRILGSEVDDVADEETTEKKFEREVVDALHVLAIVGILCREPTLHHPVEHRECERLKRIEIGRVELIARD